MLQARLPGHPLMDIQTAVTHHGSVPPFMPDAVAAIWVVSGAGRHGRVAT